MRNKYGIRPANRAGLILSNFNGIHYVSCNGECLCEYLYITICLAYS